MFRRSDKIRVFDPDNPEYALASSMSSEFIEAISPLTLWWSVDRIATEAVRDDLDKIYSEKSSGTRKMIFKPPNRVYLSHEQNPVLVELSRLGIETLQELTLVVNIDAFMVDNKGIEPGMGDYCRISNLQSPEKYLNWVYQISTVVPFDWFNSRYMSYHIYCEQTPLNDAPDAIKNYIDML